VGNYGAGRDFDWLQCNERTWFSCYWTPNCDISAFRRFLDALERAVEQFESIKVVFAGDFYVKSPKWGSSAENERGVLLSELVASLGLTVSNTGSTLTYQKDASTSVIDVTFSRGPLCEIGSWAVLTGVESRSNHRYYISFHVVTLKRIPGDLRELTPRHWDWAIGKLDHALDVEYLCGNASPTMAIDWREAEAVDRLADDLRAHLTAASNASIPPKVNANRRRSKHWWTAKISELHRTCLATRERRRSFVIGWRGFPRTTCGLGRRRSMRCASRLG
jgi:hypothetical protein